MAIIEEKTGRPRLYNFHPVAGIENKDVGCCISILDELLERVVDQIVHLPPEALDFTPAGTTLSIGRLVVHLAWAEARMMKLASGKGIDGELERRLASGSLETFKKAPESSPDSEHLIALLRRVRREVTIPFATSFQDIEAMVKGAHPLKTIKAVFMHLFWHWTYHSGHIGLLSLQAGYDYTWTFPKD
ncbi:MAG: DinB family protein [Spirochaetota bacterium]